MWGTEEWWPGIYFANAEKKFDMFIGLWRMSVSLFYMSKTGVGILADSLFCKGVPRLARI